MKTSVYYSQFNRTIKAVSGSGVGSRLSVNRVALAQLPPDQPDPQYVWEGRAAALHEFWKQNHLPHNNVRLILDADMVITKKLETPPLPYKQVVTLVENELSGQVPENKEYLYDYTVLDRGGHKDQPGGIVLGSAAELELVRNYEALYRRLGIELERVDVSLAAGIRLLNRVGGRKHSFICAVLEDNKISLFMYLNGVYRFFNRGLILEQRGTPAAAVEISRQLSSMIQFNISQRTDTEISAAFVCGLFPDEMAYCDNMSQSLNIPVSVLPDNSKLIGKSGQAARCLCCCSDFFFPLGGLFND